jgi:flagellar motor protein MotB
MAAAPITRMSLTIIAVAMLCVAGGCSQNPYYAAPGAAAWQVPPGTMSVGPAEAQISELTRRVQLLDDNNRQLHTQLAQSEQKTQVFKDESELLRRQLADVSQQLETTRLAASDAESRVRGMQASAQLRGGATITPNTNLSQQVSRLSLSGVAVEQDGDVIRIVVPSDQLFQPGTATLLPQAAATMDPIASQLQTVFPRQRIGIEAYSDNTPIYGGTVATTHQLTSAQASAVLDLLTRRSGMSSQQLFTVAQGANHPRQGNETPAGRAANRRIEIVVYPDSF